MFYIMVRTPFILPLCQITRQDPLQILVPIDLTMSKPTPKDRSQKLTATEGYTLFLLTYLLGLSAGSGNRGRRPTRNSEQRFREEGNSGSEDESLQEWLGRIGAEIRQYEELERRLEQSL